MSDCRHCGWVNGYKTLAIQDGSASMAYDEHSQAEHHDRTPPSCEALS